MRNKTSGIYCITNIVNGKRLIGQSTDIKQRWRYHRYLLKKDKHPNTYFQHAWNKDGEASFRFEIILLCPMDKLNDEEIRFIKEQNTMDRDLGYNLMPGGKRPIFSKETLRKMSEAQRGKKSHLFGKPRSEETKRKIGLANSGPNNWNYGGHLSAETKEKMAEAHRGEKNHNFGRDFSPEHRKRISNAQKGEKGYWFGKQLSEEIKQKISESHKKRLVIVQVNT